MGALDYLRSRGLTAARAGQKLRVFPSTRITPADVEYIKLHRMELIAELAANDGEERRAHWRVCLRGELLCVIAGGPMTKQEALDAARFHWPEAEIGE